MDIDLRGNNLFLTSDITNANFNPPKFMKQVTRGIASDSQNKTDYQTVNTSVNPIAGQPTNTDISVDNGEDNSFNGTDAYRNGTPGSSDPEVLFPRTLDGEEEIIADMTLSTEEGSDDILNAYSRFFLQSVSEGEQEKYQIVETFTSFYAFFYGKRPPVYRFSGVMLNDRTHKWTNDFKFVYENYFRGTKAAELRAQVLLTYDGKLVTGFPLSISMQTDAINPKGVPFTMDVLVIEHTPLYFSKDIASLLEKKASDLKAMKDKANRALAKMNSNVPSTQANVAREVVNGITTSNSTTADGQKKTETPTSFSSEVNDSRQNANTAAGNGMSSRASSQTALKSVSPALASIISGS